MAIVATNTYRSAYTFIASLTCLDADVAATNIAHGITAGVPNVVTLTPMLAIANHGGWAATLDATNVVLTKANVIGSGGTTPGTTPVMRVMVQLPHSIV